MKDKDSKLIWEAFKDAPFPPLPKIPGKPPELPKREEGLLAENMIMIIEDTPKGGRVLQNGQGMTRYHTEKDAEMFMHRINADRGPDDPERKMHAGIVAKKGTRVTVTYWGPRNERFQIRMDEPIEIHDRAGYGVHDNQLQLMNETKDELIEKWVDFSSSGKARSALKGLR